MQRLILNKDKNQYELYPEEYLNLAVDPKYLIKAGSIEDIIEYKILELISDLVLATCSNVAFKKKFDKQVYVSKVIKSRSKKSVFQYRNLTEKYNLPEPFRETNFNSVVATLTGPFKRKTIGNELIETGDWYKYEVIFVGSEYQCAVKIAHIIMEGFILNEVCNCLPVAVKEPVNLDEIDIDIEGLAKIEELMNEDSVMKMINRIYFDLKKEYQEELENSFIEEHDYQDFLDMAEEEERVMDEETDGFWRWNID